MKTWSGQNPARPYNPHGTRLYPAQTFMKNRALIACLLLATSPLAYATTYKCKMADGRTVFQDIPCAPDAKTENVRGGQQGSAWVFEKRNDSEGKPACFVQSPSIGFGSRYRPIAVARLRVEYTKDGAIAELVSAAEPGTPSMPFSANTNGVGINIKGQAFLSDVRLSPNGTLRFGAKDSAKLVTQLQADEPFVIRARHIKSEALFDSMGDRIEGFVAAQQLAQDCVATTR